MQLKIQINQVLGKEKKKYVYLNMKLTMTPGYVCVYVFINMITILLLHINK